MSNPKDILQDAIEVAHIGLAELNPEGYFVMANAAFCSMLDKNAEDLIGRHWTVTVHPEDRPRAQQAYRLARTSGGGYVEIRGLRGSSSFVYQALTVTAIRNAKNEFTGYHCLRQDISSYKREQEALTLAVESAPNGMLMLNPDGHIRSVNRAVEKLFGYTREELSGQPVEILLPEHYQHRFINAQVTPGRDPFGLRKDGVEIPLQIHWNRIDTHNGALILCTIVDITERVLYQKQLELAKQAAEAANHAKSDFLARMSHEIRTPMNLIMGMNALLLEGPLNEKQRKHVEISHRNVRRLLRLINGILDLSKVEAGMLSLEAAPFDLIEVLEECAATTSSAMERKGLEFEMSIDPEVWRFWTGDVERVQQVLLNLIGNSIKFTAHGKIEVRVRGEEKGDSHGLRFEVSDTGCGVPADKETLIFEAFQQAEGAMNRAYEGTGLGLSIAKTLVEMMGGSIWVEEKSGPGAKFVFTAFFPMALAQDVANKSVVTSDRADQATAPGTRILIAEDNPENVILLRAYLEGLPLSLHFAANGVEALDKRRRGNYDVVMMDVQMPIMDGYTATREIRAWEAQHRAPRVPIVALTAHALSGAAAESIAAGCDGHLTKPVERAGLIDAIARFAKRALEPVAVALSPAIMARRPAFLENRRLDLQKMKDALEAKDFDAIRRIGHNCKGTGTGYGFPEISSSGSHVECAARALDLKEIEKSILEFEGCLHKATAA
jgi:PAS domain S-box-containing protein